MGMRQVEGGHGCAPGSKGRALHSLKQAEEAGRGPGPRSAHPPPSARCAARSARRTGRTGTPWCAAAPAAPSQSTPAAPPPLRDGPTGGGTGRMGVDGCLQQGARACMRSADSAPQPPILQLLAQTMPRQRRAEGRSLGLARSRWMRMAASIHREKQTNECDAYTHWGWPGLAGAWRHAGARQKGKPQPGQFSTTLTGVGQVPLAHGGVQVRVLAQLAARRGRVEHRAAQRQQQLRRLQQQAVAAGYGAAMQGTVRAGQDQGRVGEARERWVGLGRRGCQAEPAAGVHHGSWQGGSSRHTTAEGPGRLTAGLGLPASASPRAPASAGRAQAAASRPPRERASSKGCCTSPPLVLTPMLTMHLASSLVPQPCASSPPPATPREGL